MAEPDPWVETFLVESWGEHLRQHQRITVEDRALEERIQAFLKQDVPPIVSHLILGASPDAGFVRMFTLTQTSKHQES